MSSSRATTPAWSTGELRYFQHSLEIHDSIIDYAMLCWMHNGVELLPNHGFPLRLMVPGPSHLILH